MRIATQFEPDDGSGTKAIPTAMSVEDLELLRTSAHTVSNLDSYVPEAVTLSGRGEAVRANGYRIPPG